MTPAQTAEVECKLGKYLHAGKKFYLGGSDILGVQVYKMDI